MIAHRKTRSSSMAALLIVTACAPQALPSAKGAEAFQVEGYIDVAHFETKPPSYEKALFQLKVVGDKFRIRSFPGDYGRIEAGFDGTNLVMIHEADEKKQRLRTERDFASAPPVVRPHLKEEQPSPNILAPSISVGLLAGFIPRSYPDATVPILWLAFASEEFFREHPQSLRPIYDLNPLLSSEQDLNYSLRATKPCVPAKVEFLADGIADRHMGARFSPPFERGFTNAVYLLNSVTNYRGVTLPKSFTLREVSPTFRNGSRGDHLEKISTWRGVVTNISSAVESDFLPAIPKGRNMYFSDERNGASIGYVTNRLLTAEEAADAMRMR